MTRRWPLDALLDATGYQLRELRAVVKADPWLAARNGLSDWQADRWAICCGLHPAMVWGIDWVEAGLSENDRRYLAGGWRQAWLWREAQAELDEGMAA